MHDLDRAMFETGEISRPNEHAEHQEFLEILGEQMGEGGYELPRNSARNIDRTSREVELATELLEVSSEAELEQFLGNLMSSAVGAARNFARSDTGRALGGILKNAAGQALPVIGRGIGSYIDPKYGDIGQRAGTAVKGWLGLELEGLSQEDREFEMARALVRFVDSATRHAAKAPAGTPPQSAALAAATAAAQRHVPGLVGHLTSGGTAQGKRSSGRWERHGDHIILFGA